MADEVVLGVDSGTQSTKVVAVSLATGETLAEGRAPHSGLDTQDPREWWQALRLAVRETVRDEVVVRGIAVAGQQHGLVTLDAIGEVVRPAPLWNNVAAAPDAERLNALADFPAITGTRLVASITIAKLAHLARTAPEDLCRTASICLPHDYLNLRLTGALTTDRGEASGSGWWAPDGTVRRDLLALATDDAVAERLQIPVVLGPNQMAGTSSAQAAADLSLPAGIPVGPGTGDNMAAALGVGAGAGEVVVSLGTSGTAYAVSDHATYDETGEVAGFADATGRFLPLACMLNCTRVVDQFASLFGIEPITALDRAGRLPPGANGLLLMPYLGGERTPNLPAATGSLAGLTGPNLVPDLIMRAAVDGVAAGIAYCIDALNRVGVTGSEITLVGGGARHPVWQQAIADATGRPVQVRRGTEHAARGAAVQIAAIARAEPVADLAARWRPAIIARAQPRPGAREAFRLEDRRAIIATLARAGSSPTPAT